MGGRGAGPALGPGARARTLDQDPSLTRRPLLLCSQRRGEAVRGTAGALGLSRDRRCRNSWRGINLFSATARQKPIRADPTGASVWGETNTRRANPGMLILAGTFQLPVGQSPGSQEGGPDGLCPLVPSVSCCTPAPPPPTQTRSLREVWAPAPGVLPVCPPQAGPQTHAPPGAFLQPHLPVPSTALDLAPWGLQREHWEDGGLQSELSTGTSPHIREQGSRTRSAPPDAHSDHNAPPRTPPPEISHQLCPGQSLRTPPNRCWCLVPCGM